MNRHSRHESNTFSLERSYTLKIRDLDCLTNKRVVEEALKRDCPAVSRGQMLVIVTVTLVENKVLVNYEWQFQALAIQA